MKLAPVIAMLLIAAPAMAQTTLVLPEPDGGYMVIPLNGPVTQVLSEPGGGYLILEPGRSPTIVLPQPGQAQPFDQYRPLDQPGFEPE